MQPTSELKRVFTVGGRNKNEQGEAHFILSKDSSKFALIGEADFKAKDKQKISFVVFDNNMTKIWEKAITLPYNDELFDIKSFVLTNQGSVLMLGKKYKDKVRESKGGQVNYTYEVFVYNQGNANGLQKTITLGSTNFVSDVYFHFDNKNYDMITVLGVYGEKNQGASIKGFFSFSFDKDMNIGKKEMTPFAPSFIESFTKVRKSGLPKFLIKTVIQRADGSMTAIGEWTSETRIYSRNGVLVRIVYIDADMFFINMDSNYKVTWMKQVDKYQKSAEGSGFSIELGNITSLIRVTIPLSKMARIAQYSHSFVKYQNGDNVTLVYNDNIANKNIMGGKDAKSMGKDPALFALTIDANGNMKKKVLQEVPKDDLLVYPLFSNQINEKEVLLFSKEKRKYMLGTITFN